MDAIKNSFERRYLNSLSIAHKSSLLFYLRDPKSLELAHKIRPEVQRILKVSEQKDVSRAIEKYNSSPNQQGISLLVADVDHMSVKLLEYLKRRTTDNNTRNFPLLPVIILIGSAEQDLLTSIVNCGGYDIVLNDPVSAKDLFSAILELLARFNTVQTVYSDIHKYKESRKYTYLPIFERGRVELNDDLENDSVESASIGDATNKCDSDAESEIDTWSNSSVVVEEFLALKRAEKQLQRYKTTERIMDPKDRAIFDSALLESLEDEDVDLAKEKQEIVKRSTMIGEENLVRKRQGK